MDGRRIRERVRAVHEAGAVSAARVPCGADRERAPGLTLAQTGGTVPLTDNYLRVRVPGDGSENERVKVRITAAGETLAGEVVAAGVSPARVSCRASS